MKIVSVVGARPNFMKIAPFIRAIEEHNQATTDPVAHVLVHTGQHYDDAMSRSFFDSLGIPEADINLGIGSGTHAEQVGNTMIAFEKVLESERPDWVVVVGDVNATAACSLAAVKMRIKVAHIEAGLRSGDRAMPEEINRLVTDSISDLLLTPCELSTGNLRREGFSEEKIAFVGDIMIDTLESEREKAAALDIQEIIEANRRCGGGPPRSQDGGGPVSALTQPPLSMGEGSPFAVLTLHRPSNVDERESLEPLVRCFIDDISTQMPLIWTLHPRTKGRLQEFGLMADVEGCENIILLNPLGYHELLRLNMGATVVLTDSGGLQEECSVLGSPCLTLRDTTERPATLREHGGVCVLTGNDIELIRKEFKASLACERKASRPELWDGHTAERCLSQIIAHT